MAQVFISYSKKDYLDPKGNIIQDNVIDTIIESLSAHGISYWIDREGLDPGVTYADRISKNIRDCDVFLFLATENSNASVWTLREISSAIDFGKTVLPVRIDHSRYADSVSLYLSSIQYIDWLELGERESMRRIIDKIQDSGQSQRSQIRFGKLPKATTFTLYAALIVLTAIYASLTYQFLWATSLRSSEIMGGLTGFICEFGVLMSIYYILRMLKKRRCVFILPAATVLIVLLASLMLRDADVMSASILLLIGWLGILITCFIRTPQRESFFKQMSKEQTLVKLTDAENLLILYLIIKCVILVVAHYTGASMDKPIITNFLF